MLMFRFPPVTNGSRAMPSVPACEDVAVVTDPDAGAIRVGYGTLWRVEHNHCHVSCVAEGKQLFWLLLCCFRRALFLWNCLCGLGLGNCYGCQEDNAEKSLEFHDAPLLFKCRHL